MTLKDYRSHNFITICEECGLEHYPRKNKSACEISCEEFKSAQEIVQPVRKLSALSEKYIRMFAPEINKEIVRREKIRTPRAKAKYFNDPIQETISKRIVRSDYYIPIVQRWQFKYSELPLVISKPMLDLIGITKKERKGAPRLIINQKTH